MIIVCSLLLWAQNLLRQVCQQREGSAVLLARRLKLLEIIPVGAELPVVVLLRLQKVLRPCCLAHLSRFCSWKLQKMAAESHPAQPEWMRRQWWRRRAVERPGCAWRWALGGVLCLLGVFVGPTGAWNVCPPPARPAACSTGAGGVFAQTPEGRSPRGPGYSLGCWTPPRKRCLPLRLQLTSGAAGELPLPIS